MTKMETRGARGAVGHEGDRSLPSTGRNSRARTVCAVVFAVITTGIAGLHGYWASGGKWGIEAASEGLEWAKDPVSLGLRLGTWGLVVVILVAALVVLVRTGVVPLRVPRRLVAAGCWIVALGMLGVAVVNFDDPYVWSRAVFAPTALVLCALVAVVALSGGRSASKETTSPVLETTERSHQ